MALSPPPPRLAPGRVGMSHNRQQKVPNIRAQDYSWSTRGIADIPGPGGSPRVGWLGPGQLRSNRQAGKTPAVSLPTRRGRQVFDMTRPVANRINVWWVVAILPAVVIAAILFVAFLMAGGGAAGGGGGY